MKQFEFNDRVIVDIPESKYHNKLGRIAKMNKDSAHVLIGGVTVRLSLDGLKKVNEFNPSLNIEGEILSKIAVKIQAKYDALIDEMKELNSEILKGNLNDKVLISKKISFSEKAQFKNFLKSLLENEQSK